MTTAHTTAAMPGRRVLVTGGARGLGAAFAAALVQAGARVVITDILDAAGQALAQQLGPDGITVNAIAPGLTLVEATAYIPEARHDLYLKGRALQRPQVPEDLTAALLFLLGTGSGFITGQLLPVNGGFVMN